MGNIHIKHVTDANPHYCVQDRQTQGQPKTTALWNSVIDRRMGFIDILMFLLLLIAGYTFFTLFV